MRRPHSAAEERLGAAVDLAGARGDLEGAFEAADALAGDEAPTLLRECQAEARQIVADRWTTVAAVADELANNRDGWLEEARLRRLGH